MIGSLNTIIFKFSMTPGLPYFIFEYSHMLVDNIWYCSVIGKFYLIVYQDVY